MPDLSINKRPWEPPDVGDPNSAPSEPKRLKVALNFQVSCTLDSTTFPTGVADETVCFGMLDDIYIKICCAWHQWKKLEFEELHDDTGVYSFLELQFQDGICEVQDKNGILVARMNKKTYLALKGASEKINATNQQGFPESLTPSAPATSVFHCRGLVSSQRLHDVSPLNPNHKDADSTCKISIIVMGNRSSGKLVASGFSFYHLYFQHPLPMPEGFAYENPQYLNLSGLCEGVGDDDATLEIPGELSVPQGFDEFDLEDIELDQILDSLPQQPLLSEVDVHGTIKTPLMRHQKIAVEFILQREGGVVNHIPSLWDKVDGDFTDAEYRHIITGAKSTTPDDMLGGILADDMGLGKTLTMLAAVVANPKSDGLWRATRAMIPDNDGMPVRSTLVIVPSSLLIDGWIEEIEKHVVPGTLKYHKYHGTGRILPGSPDLGHDIILTTYGTVSADLRRGGGVLERYHWHRIVLDEAHTIRNKSTEQWKALMRLSANIRWCITGTPIQNSLEDLSSLVQYLRVPILEDPQTFRKYIAPRQMISARGISTPNYDNLKLLLRSICMRRCKNILDLPGFTHDYRRLQFLETERADYNKMATSCSQTLQEAIMSRGGAPHRPILKCLLQLRIFCNLGMAGIPGTDSQNSEDSLNLDEKVSLSERYAATRPDLCHCGELVYNDDAALRKSSKQTPKGACPVCQPESKKSQSEAASTTVSTSGLSFTPGEVLSRQFEYPTPTKMQELLNDIKTHKATDKSIIFSFWKRTLDHACQLLKREGIVFCRVDGSVRAKERGNILAQFCSDNSIRVLLMTLGTGAMGINNLSVATRVYIVEPQWNPSVENQAIGRVLRLGQDKEVSIIRYIMQDTVEEKTVECRQHMKMSVSFASGLGSSNRREAEAERRARKLQGLQKVIESTIVR